MGGTPALDAARAVVTDVDLHEAARLCRRDPVGSVLAASRVESLLARGETRGGSSVWGFVRGGSLAALCWAGANLVPVGDPADDEAWDAFGAYAITQGRRCSSLVGPAPLVLGLWDRLAPRWGPAREARVDQPSLVIDHEPAVDPDPQVTVTTPDQMATLLPACVDMFLEEVGYSPLTGAPGAYEARVRTLVEEGRSFARTRTGPGGEEVLFKAELGAVSREVAQVQGVWVAPWARGRGLAAPGMAAVVRAALDVAPAVSLYVNSYNLRALAAYRRVGFRQVGTYATVLF